MLQATDSLSTLLAYLLFLSISLEQSNTYLDALLQYPSWWLKVLP